MQSHRQKPVRHARTALFWGLVGFAAAQLTAAVAVEHWLPDGRDPEFTLKAEGLRARRHQAPDSPLVLMLGSSRTSLGFRACDVQATWGDEKAQVYNFGLSGGGPLLELLALRRLLNEGIRPDLLMIELLPPAFNQPGRHPLEEVWLQGGRLRLSELHRLQIYHSDPMRLVRRWWKSRLLLPWAGVQRAVQDCLATNPADRAPGPGGGKVDTDGWEAHFLNGVTPEQRRYYLQLAHDQYHDSMGEFHLASQPVQAIHALLDLCRAQHIPVVLILMPEGTDFQGFYPPPLRAALDAFLTNLSREQGLPLIDARNWLRDEDLWDSHHPLPSGAAIFTERLAREVIHPLLRTLPRRGRPAQIGDHLRSNSTSSRPPSEISITRGVLRLL
jgi:hypothetical protein